MDPRVRAGLFAGGGAAIATLLLAITGLGICGPILAILAGVNVAFLLARNPQLRGSVTNAAVTASLYGGVIIGLAQTIGTVIFIQTPLGQSSLEQASQMTGVTITSGSDVWLGLGCAALLLGLLDVGLLMGAATVTARLLGNRSSVPARPPVYYEPPQYPYYPPMPPAPPPQPPIPTPPPAYPPPPSFYGLPDTPRDDAPQDANS